MKLGIEKRNKHFSVKFGSKVSLIVAIILLIACGAAPVKEGSDATEGLKSSEELYIVDCALPGQVKQLGTMKYIGPRRPVKTTASDCSIRGGEYVAYDRADYRSALKVWLPQAEKGDPEAQTYVGEIFEKGLGQEPDYVSAVSWYRKAADQGYSRAQINLGYMYEKGQGVPQDTLVALNWYRKASGVGDDDLVLSSDAATALAETRKELSAQLATAKVQSDYLKRQLGDLERKYTQQKQQMNDYDPKALEFAEQEIAALTQLYEGAIAQRDKAQKNLENTELAYRKFSSDSMLRPEALEQANNLVLKDIDFGRYFALIIGNQDYLHLDDLRSPLKDAHRLKHILESKYGFSTLLIENGSEKNILNTINNFYDQIGEDDNLLIYYAGHGNISRSSSSRTERGYWLPVDASKDNISNWINNSVISDHLDRLKARSVLVVSDSCYAGYLGSEKSPFLFGVSSSTHSKKAIEAGLARRARVVISSGGTKPVLDGTNMTHSVFAGAFINVLEQNNDALRDSALFSELSVNVRKRSEQIKTAQTPEMKPVREAGHEGGTFYFVPVGY